MTTRHLVHATSTAAAALVLAGAALSAPAAAAPATRAAATISASAPCSGKATISIRLSDDPRPHIATHVVVKVTNAHPGSVWATRVSVSSNDSGSVLGGDLRANDAGVVRVSTNGDIGRNTVKARLTSRAGQTCMLQLSGAVTPA